VPGAAGQQQLQERHPEALEQRERGAQRQALLAVLGRRPGHQRRLPQGQPEEQRRLGRPQRRPRPPATLDRVDPNPPHVARCIYSQSILEGQFSAVHYQLYIL